MDVIGQLHALAVSVPEKLPVNRLIRECLDPRAGVGALEKWKISCTCQDPKPGPPSTRYFYLPCVLTVALWRTLGTYSGMRTTIKRHSVSQGWTVRCRYNAVGYICFCVAVRCHRNVGNVQQQRHCQCLKTESDAFTGVWIAYVGQTPWNFGKWTSNTWKVLKHGARKGRGRLFEPIKWEMKKYIYIPTRYTM